MNDIPYVNAIFDAYPSEYFIKADGFDDAIIGVDENSMRLIYSVSKCIEVLMINMDYDDAMEYFHFNMKDGYIGEKTPIWCFDNF